jgi:hypothetical protein
MKNETTGEPEEEVEATNEFGEATSQLNHEL